MRKLYTFSIALVMAVLVFVPTAFAGGQDLVLLDKSETVRGPFYVNAGGQVEIAGTIEGDLVVAGGNVNVTGPVGGDVIAAGGNVNVTGDVAGNVRVAGGQVIIRSSVEKNVTAFGGTVVLDEISDVKGGVLASGGIIELRGQVNDKVLFAGGAAIVAGSFASDVELIVGDDSNNKPLILYPSASIDGNLMYKAPQEVDIPEGMSIGGEVVYSKISPHYTKKDKDYGAAFAGFFAVGLLIKIFALILIGLVITLFVPKVLHQVTDFAYADPGKRVLMGLAWVILTPLVAIALFFTVIGIPLGVIALVMYFVGLYVIKVFSSFVIGKFITKKLKLKKVSDFWTVVIGVVVYVLLSSIPVLGWVFCFGMTIWLFGALFAFKEHEMVRYK
ncbi:MAG: hypothetical protein ACPGO5_00305 [Patescibacteria group bacterium]